MAYITGCALMAACLSLALVALIGRATSDVVELCGETRENIILNKASDLEQLSLKGCPKRTVSAYYDLLDMASEDEPVCSMDKVSKITRFFDNYHGDPSDQEESEKLPGGIRRFSVAYGMLVGHICRVALLDKFFNDTNDYLFDGDFRALQPWIKNDGPLAHLLDPLVIHMEFLLPSYFEPVYPGFREDYKQSLFADVSHGDLASAKQVCQYRFKPMYERAILPISHLDHTCISYLYRNRKIALKDSPELCDSIALWQRIVFVCELLLNTNRQRKEASRSGEKTTSLVANCSDDDDDNNDDEELDPDDRTTREDLVNSTGSQSTICKIQYEPEPSYFDSEAQLCSIPWVNQLIMRNVNMKKFAATKISRTMSKIMPHIRRFKESWQDNTLDVVEKLYNLSCPDNKHGTKLEKSKRSRLPVKRRIKNNNNNSKLKAAAIEAKETTSL